MRALAPFVIDFSALLLVGPHDATLIAVARTLTQGLADRHHPQFRRQLICQVATVIVAIQAAGAAHLLLGGTLGHFSWPRQAAPIGAAGLVYWLIESASAEVVVPLLGRHSIDRSHLGRVLASFPNYIVAGSLAVALVEAIDHAMWQLLAVALVPLLLLHRAHSAHVRRLQVDKRRDEVTAALQQGICVIDSTGRVTHWDEALEAILGCSKRQAVGRSLGVAVPALEKTNVPRAINDALLTQTSRESAGIEVSLAEGVRVLQLIIRPFDAGVTVFWREVTESWRADQQRRRQEDRLALAAEGAYDGLWAWDLRGDEFFASGRWKAMLGQPATAGTGKSAEWIERIHPDDMGSFREALKAHLTGQSDQFEHEHRLRHEDGTYKRYLCRAVASRASNRRAIRMAGSLTDTNERSLSQERLRGAGLLDALTGLCNRVLFVERVGRRLDEFKQGRGGRFAVLYLDLDRFKVVNDSLGHLVGDELLIAVSRQLEACVRPVDLVSRLGGDEFAILLNGLNDEQQANVIAFRIRESLSAPFQIGGREVFTSASIGIAFGHVHYSNADDIMRDADTAMYHAKSRGKARHELFDADMHARTKDRLDLETDLRHAVNGNHFEVHYQPIVMLSSGMCVGFESLVRWTRNGEPISPATFIPIAEELGLIEPIGTWVLEQACLTFSDWQRRFPTNGLDCITVNVSGRQLMQQNFPYIVEQAIRKSGLRPRDLRLEITETALMDSPTTAAEMLRDLRDLGVKIYLDDFGTGYSSLSHLHQLPVDALKIDRSFVRSLALSDRPAIVESILALARTLNTSVVAEGIESELQSRELERLGCTHAQGYLFSRPVSAESAEKLLIANQPLGPKQPRPPLSLAARRASEVPYSATRFEWPEHLANRQSR